MGEEYGETAPFPYFTSHGDPTLVANVRKGRADEMARLGTREEPLDPQDEATFRSAKLDFGLRTSGDHARLLAWYKELLRARRDIAAFGPEGGRQAVAFEDERLLYARRWNRDSEVFVMYHFGDHPVTVTLPVPSGTWKRSLVSTEPRFGGADGRAPEEIMSTGLVRVSLGPSEAALYVRVR